MARSRPYLSESLLGQELHFKDTFPEWMRIDLAADLLAVIRVRREPGF